MLKNPCKNLFIWACYVHICSNLSREKKFHHYSPFFLSFHPYFSFFSFSGFRSRDIFLPTFAHSSDYVKRLGLGIWITPIYGHTAIRGRPGPIFSCQSWVRIDVGWVKETFNFWLKSREMALIRCTNSPFFIPCPRGTLFWCRVQQFCLPEWHAPLRVGVTFVILLVLFFYFFLSLSLSLHIFRCILVAHSWERVWLLFMYNVVYIRRYVHIGF